MDLRYRPGQTLKVNIPASREPITAKIVNFDGRAAKICFNHSVLPGTPLRLDFDDSMLLGEVSACEPGQGEYLISVEVREAIPVLSGLGRLVSAVMSAGCRAPNGTPAGVTNHVA